MEKRKNENSWYFRNFADNEKLLKQSDLERVKENPCQQRELMIMMQSTSCC